MYKLGKSSIENLITVNEDLQSVVSRAIKETPVDFSVACGIRTLQEQKEYFKNGKSQTKNSRHLHGLAVDIYPWVDGKSSFKDEHMNAVADVIKEVAVDMGIPIKWGGDWQSFIDKPHFELDRLVYPDDKVVLQQINDFDWGVV